MPVSRLLSFWGLLLACLAIVPAAHAAVAPRLAGQGIAWPQDLSDLKPDPAAHYGRLPNGMTYILYKNTAKARGGAIRLRIAAGSMQEGDNQRGLAHFVEHMAFNGSTNIAEGELTKLLAREGFAFGQDVNAFTDYETTDYVLNLPGNDADQFETAVFILREIAGNLTFAPAAIERERGVILSEERLRASPQSRSQQAFIDAAYAGQLYARRNPIGLVDTIRTAPRQAIVDYYNDYYRPENATLIIVGDFDLNGMEKRIKAQFGGWAPARPGPPKTADYGTYTAKGLTTEMFTEANLYESLSATWFRPTIDMADTTQSRTRGMIKYMATQILNARYQQLAQAPDAPYLSASVTYDNETLSGNTTFLTVVPKPGQQKAAFIAALQALHQFTDHGVDAAEVTAFVTQTDAQMSNMVKTQKTQFSDSIASDLEDSINDDGVYISAQQYADLWLKIRPALTVDATNTLAKWLFTGDGPMLSRQGQDPAVFDADAMKAAYAEVQASSDTAWTQGAAVAWPYTDFGAPVKAARKMAVNLLDYDRFVYPNGVIVNIKSSPLIKNEVTVAVRFAGGYRLFSPADAPLLQKTNIYDVVDGGLAKISPDAATKALADKTVGVAYSLDDDDATLSGTTTTDSYNREMQLLMAYTVDPGYRADAFASKIASLDYIYSTMTTDPENVLNIGLSSFLTSGDRRARFPTRPEMAQTSLADMKAMLQKTMTGVPVEVTIAGDINEASALREVERTFALLPPVPDHVTPAPDADHIALPTDVTPQIYYHDGRDDQEVAFAAFPTTDALADIPATRAMDLLAAVFDSRLSDELREREGATYDSQVTTNLSETFKGYGYIWAQATIKPDMDQAFYDAVTKIAGDLQSKPVTGDELDRARSPMISGVGDTYKTNDDWQSVIAGLYGDDRLWKYRVDLWRQYMAVSPADLQRMAQLYLKPDLMLRAKSVPRPKQQIADSDSR